MKLREITSEGRAGGVRFTGAIERPDSSTFEVYFDFEGADLADARPTAEAFAAAMLIPAMRANEPLEIPQPISPRLHLQLPRIRDLFHAWYPDFSRIEIRTESGPAPQPGRARAATFFSGGVDSFYSLLKYRSGHARLPVSLGHVIFMRGVETVHESSALMTDSERLVRQIAEEVGVEVVTGVTNVRTVSQQYGGQVRWEDHYYGSALSSIALALSSIFQIVCIPSGYNYNHLIPVGSSPVLDERYSTEALTILYDGAEADRASKVGRIMEWNPELVLRYLRVCHFNNGGAWNCGACPKCVRTQVALAALGVLDRAQLFQHNGREHWAHYLSRDHAVLVEQNRRFVIANGADPELLSIIRSSELRRKFLEPYRNYLGLAIAVSRPLRSFLRSVGTRA